MSNPGVAQRGDLTYHVPDKNQGTAFDAGAFNFGSAATDTVGFYGTTAIVQPSVTHIATTVISQVGTTGKWAFSTSTAALAFVSKVISIQNKLALLGLVAKS